MHHCFVSGNLRYCRQQLDCARKDILHFTPEGEEAHTIGFLKEKQENLVNFKNKSNFQFKIPEIKILIRFVYVTFVSILYQRTRDMKHTHVKVSNGVN